jgi:hypothetical protein
MWAPGRAVTTRSFLLPFGIIKKELRQAVPSLARDLDPEEKSYATIRRRIGKEIQKYRNRKNVLLFLLEEQSQNSKKYFFFPGDDCYMIDLKYVF